MREEELTELLDEIRNSALSKISADDDQSMPSTFASSDVVFRIDIDRAAAESVASYLPSFPAGPSAVMIGDGKPTQMRSLVKVYLPNKMKTSVSVIVLS